MENKNIILQEAAQISPAVASIGNENPYRAPNGYFDQLTAQVLAKVQGEALPATPAPYAVPEGYFDNLAGNIMAKIKTQAAPVAEPAFLHAEDELASLPPCLPTPYSIPAGYFDTLAGNVLAAIKQQAETTLPFIAMPYTAPQGYFDGLAASVMAKINTNKVQHGSEAAAELQELSPLLAGIGKQMPYQVPVGYFQQLSVTIPAEEKPAAKVISMYSSRRKWFTYAAAACVVLILGVGGFMFRNGNVKGSETTYEKALANVSDADIKAYLDEQPATTIDAGAQQDEQEPDVQNDIEQTSTQDIQEYLNENSGPDEKRGKDI